MTKFVEFFITLAVVALAACTRTQDVDLGTTSPIDAGAPAVDAESADADVEKDATLPSDSDPDTDELVEESMRHGSKGKHGRTEDSGVAPQSAPPS